MVLALCKGRICNKLGASVSTVCLYVQEMTCRLDSTAIVCFCLLRSICVGSCVSHRENTCFCVLDCKTQTTETQLPNHRTQLPNQSQMRSAEANNTIHSGRLKTQHPFTRQIQLTLEVLVLESSAVDGLATCPIPGGEVTTCTQKRCHRGCGYAC